MKEESMSEEINQAWFSTYGLITAKRILERYKIQLADEELQLALKVPNTFYHHILQIPLKNVLNGIILQQGHDYQVYSQKLLIGYLMSGENNKEEGTPGTDIREQLEGKRQILMILNEDFHKSEIAHERLIANSQVLLISEAKRWKTEVDLCVNSVQRQLNQQGIVQSEENVKQGLTRLLLEYDIIDLGNTISPERWTQVFELWGVRGNTESIKSLILDELQQIAKVAMENEDKHAEFLVKTRNQNHEARHFRSDFKQFIIETKELIQLLPDFRRDIQKEQEELHFDADLGEEENS